MRVGMGFKPPPITSKVLSASWGKNAVKTGFNGRGLEVREG